MAGPGRLVAFLATVDLDRARDFYTDVVGLELLSSDDFAAVFDAGGTTLRITRVEEPVTAPYTVLGWRVNDVHAAVTRLRDRGAEFVRYDGMEQDDAGVWTSPGGEHVAWFRDRDGNTLSLTEG